MSHKLSIAPSLREVKKELTVDTEYLDMMGRDMMCAYQLHDMMYLIGGGSRAESYKNMKNWRFRGETLEQMHDIPFQEWILYTITSI